jgi:RNA 3'-phosphate cyclase
MIEIDGSYGEGGGSILRQALCLSLLTKKPFRINNIRANRPNPGLNNQHLASIELAKKISNSKAIGASLGSSSLEFYPGESSLKEISLDIGSAGSIVLALQSVLIPCILSGNKFKFSITGGTDVSWSPTVDYFKDIFIPCLENYSNIELQITKRGFYPRGNGNIILSIKGTNTKTPFIRDSVGSLVLIKGTINSSKNFWKNYTPEKAISLSTLSLSGIGANPSITNYSYPTESEGASILFYASFEDSINNGKYIRVGVSDIASNEDELIKKIETESSRLKYIINYKIPTDEYLADQLISIIGIFGGTIKTSNISDHTRSNVYLAELFLNKKLDINEEEKTISCESP